MGKLKKETSKINKSSIQILLIEDEKFIRDLLEEKLEDLGYTVFGLPDARKIYEVLEKEKIDIIVSGIMQPFKDGIAVLQELKKDKRYKHIPYIIVSALAGNKDIRKKALESGAQLCLGKAEFTLPEVIERIEKVIMKVTENNEKSS